MTERTEKEDIKLREVEAARRVAVRGPVRIVRGGNGPGLGRKVGLRVQRRLARKGGGKHVLEAEVFPRGRRVLS